MMPLSGAWITGIALLAGFPAVDVAQGRRVDLGEATLFIPHAARPRGGVVDLTIHLHGALSVVEPAFVEAQNPGVLIAFNRNGLSSVYTRPFSDPALFPRLIDSALAALVELKWAESPAVGRITVSSFSAGFGGVRELLKAPDHYRRIDTLVMADSLYAGYSGDPTQHVVDPALMEGFRRFALDAAAGRKTFVLTHSAQIPGGYASTTETADDLIRAVAGDGHDAEPVSVSVSWGEGWDQTSAFRRGRFQVLGFSGAEAADHMRHLRGIGRIWPRARD